MTCTRNAVSHVAKQLLGQIPRALAILEARVSPSSSTCSPDCNDWALWKTNLFSPWTNLLVLLVVFLLSAELFVLSRSWKFCNFNGRSISWWDVKSNSTSPLSLATSLSRWSPVRVKYGGKVLFLRVSIKNRDRAGIFISWSIDSCETRYPLTSIKWPIAARG